MILLWLFSCGNGGEARGSEGVDPDLAQGQRQYHLRKCVDCHGVLGDGNGPRTRLLGINPRNFSQIAAYKQGYGVEEISATLKSGIVSDPKSLMPKYPFLTDEERRQIALYVVYLSTNKAGF